MQTYTIYGEEKDGKKSMHVKRFRTGIVLGVNEKRHRLQPQFIMKDTDTKLVATGKTILGHIRASTKKEAIKMANKI